MLRLLLLLLAQAIEEEDSIIKSKKSFFEKFICYFLLIFSNMKRRNVIDDDESEEEENEEEEDSDYEDEEEEDDDEGEIEKRTFNSDVPSTIHVGHPPLPITAPDYSYVMDITEMQSLLLTKYYTHKEGEDNDAMDSGRDEMQDKITKAYTTHPPSVLNEGYRYTLTLIDTTSRKAWMYPMRSKNAETVYNSFKCFMKDVHGRIARLLSDNDKSFTQIMKNNDYFTYCLVTASHNNHKTLSIIDRFTRTFRELLYTAFRHYNARKTKAPQYSWYANYKSVINTYNNAKHDALFLRGRPIRNKSGDVKKFYYTPNEVWIYPRLRSRIRMRMYFDKLKNYIDEKSMYQKIARSEKVRVRLQKSGLQKGGENLFSNESYKKGIKRGNSWWVNGRWYTYRNLLPVGKELNEEKAFEKRLKKSKYKFDKHMAIDRIGAPRVPTLNDFKSRSRLKEVAMLEKERQSFIKRRKGRTDQDIEEERRRPKKTDDEYALDAQMRNYNRRKLRDGRAINRSQKIKDTPIELDSDEEEEINDDDDSENEGGGYFKRKRKYKKKPRRKKRKLIFI